MTEQRASCGRHRLARAQRRWWAPWSVEMAAARWRPIVDGGTEEGREGVRRRGGRGAKEGKAACMLVLECGAEQTAGLLAVRWMEMEGAGWR